MGSLRLRLCGALVAPAIATCMAGTKPATPSLTHLHAAGFKGAYRGGHSLVVAVIHHCRTAQPLLWLLLGGLVVLVIRPICRFFYLATIC